DQHLPEMKITMMTDLHCVDGFRKQFAQSRGKRVSIGQERVDQLAIILRPLRSATCQVTECTASTLQDSLRPTADVAGCDRFRSECGDIITACKRELQLGDPPSDLVHPPQIGGLLIAVPGGLGGPGGVVFDRTVPVGVAYPC